MSSEQDTSDSSQSQVEQHQTALCLGVLLVHGIGEQRPGETLEYAGTPLADWLKSWFSSRGSHVSNPPSSNEQASRDAQAEPNCETSEYVHLRITRNGEQPIIATDWIVAESYWAREFTGATYGQLLLWGLGILPFMVEQTGLTVWVRLLSGRRTMSVRKSFWKVDLTLIANLSCSVQTMPWRSWLKGMN